jgi:hypothetical protein
MKKVFFLLFAMIATQSLIYGQKTYVIGLKINPSLGYIRSGNLNKNLKAQNDSDPVIDEWNAHSRLRVNFGLGGFFEYYVKGNFAVLAEPTYNFSNTRIYISKVQTGSIKPGGRDELRISSEANIHISYFNLPVLAKYILSSSSRFYVIGGVAINFMSKPKLTSTELAAHSYWTAVGNEDIIDSTPTTRVLSKGKLDQFTHTRFNLVFGAGKMFRLNGRGRNLYIDIRYSLPLSKSTMYSSGNNFDNSLNNNVFGSVGKSNAETSVPQYKLNDFKMSVITLSLSYTLKNK